MIYRFLIYLLLISVLAACSGPGYYIQAISGQWKLMHARQDIQSLLSDPATTPELATQLETAEQIKTFAQSELDLPSNGSYSSYVEIDGDALVWNVVATPEFSLEPKKWCFPVAGCVPYRGFFKQKKADDSAEKLRNKSMDVIVSPATAYSSLGWFNDPLLSTMLSGSDVRLAAYLFHELAHQRLYVKNDGLFNEGYASFVEERGIMAWLVFDQRHADLQDWQQLQTVSEDFKGLVRQVRSELVDVYFSDGTANAKRGQKKEIYDSLLISLEKLSKEKWQGKRYYRSWFEGPLNNAKLALYNTYEGSHCAFQQLWDIANGDPKQFHVLAEEKSKLQKDERDKWLKQSCQTIAHHVNL
jgi:predicted aminopeptidase